MYNKILPITNMLTFIMKTLVWQHTFARMAEKEAIEESTEATFGEMWAMLEGNAIKEAAIAKSWGMYFASKAEALGLVTVDYATKSVTLTMKGLMMSMGLVIGLFVMATQAGDGLAAVLLMIASVVGVLAIMNYMNWGADKGPWGWAAAAAGVVAMFATMWAARAALNNFMETPISSASAGMKSDPTFSTTANYDSGGVFLGGSRMYDSGGPTTEHGMAVLQKGETIIPKTRNMLEGGITLNIGGDIVTDNAEDFAERIAQVLPEALRRQNDIGGI